MACSARYLRKAAPLLHPSSKAPTICVIRPPSVRDNLVREIFRKVCCTTKAMLTLGNANSIRRWKSAKGAEFDFAGRSPTKSREPESERSGRERQKREGCDIDVY